MAAAVTTGAANRLERMSEAEKSERLRSGHQVSADEIRSLAGPATPHFAQQIRNRIDRLIAALPTDDPAYAEGMEQIARLTELANNTGEPRGAGPGTTRGGGSGSQ